VKLPTLFLLSGLDNSTLREHIIHRSYRRIPESQDHVGVDGEPPHGPTVQNNLSCASTHR